MLQIGTVTIAPEHEPPRPGVAPPRRVQVWRPQVGLQGEYTEDWGQRSHRLVRFASSVNQGFVTTAQRDALMALYGAGAPFALITDLLVTLGQAALAYTARFDPGSDPPLFTPATPAGDLHYFDLTLMVAN